MARDLLIQNARVIDGSGSEPIEHGSVLIEGGRISRVGPADAVSAANRTDLRKLDATGLTVMPGMVDCHFHGVYQDVTCWEDYDLRRSIEHATILAARNAQTLLEVGFTSARDTGTRGMVGIAVRDMINEGVLVGPRLLAGGQIITTTGGLADGYGSWIDNRASLGRVVDGVEEVVKAVREQVKYGAETVKLEASGTGISPYSDSRKQTMTVEEMAAAVKEAHRNGVRVACHAQATESIKNAVRAGVDTVEHGSFLDEEGTELMRQAGTVLVPTISVLDLYVTRGPDVGVPQWIVEKFQGDLVEHRQSVKMALDAGIPMAVGSDSGHAFNPQSEIAYELEMMVDAGFTPMQAIESATRIGGEVIGWENEIGQLAPGMFADLLVVDGNPLEDVRMLRDPARLVSVYKEGALVGGRAAPRREELELGYELAPRPASAELDESDAIERPCCLKTSEELEH
jgi:imidazolonepropionase-like amidohydrolase